MKTEKETNQKFRFWDGDETDDVFKTCSAILALLEKGFIIVASNSGDGWVEYELKREKSHGR